MLRPVFSTGIMKKEMKQRIGHRKSYNSHKMHPDAYWHSVFLSKKNFNGVEFVAKTTKTTKIRAANELILLGLRSFYGEAIGEEITDNTEKKEHSERIKAFVWNLQKYARSQGYDIMDFMKYHQPMEQQPVSLFFIMCTSLVVHSIKCKHIW